MSKISVIFLVMLLPFNTFATNCSFNYSTNECMSYNGCGIIGDPDGMNGLDCQQCDPGYFNNYNQNSQSCIDCTNYFDTVNTGQELDNTMFAYGQSECPWKCTNNWYQSGDNCIHCPSTSTTDGAGSLSIDDCKCPSTLYMGGGYDMLATEAVSLFKASASTQRDIMSAGVPCQGCFLLKFILPDQCHHC